MGLSAGPRSPYKKWGILWPLAASAPETLVATEPNYLCKDMHQAHPQEGEADISQDTGTREAGSTQALISERSFLADVDIDT